MIIEFISSYISACLVTGRGDSDGQMEVRIDVDADEIVDLVSENISADKIGSIVDEVLFNRDKTFEENQVIKSKFFEKVDKDDLLNIIGKDYCMEHFDLYEE